MAQTRLAQFDLFLGSVIRRDSRVTVIASQNGNEFRAHLRNTGRLKELIFPGATIACERKKSGKTDARVIGAVENGSYVLLDTYVQEKAFGEVLEAGILEWLPADFEHTDQVEYNGKRFDFALRAGSETGYVEVKSAVTCEGAWASYPDAPSQRGLEHIRLLRKLATEDRPAYVVFVVTHPDCDRFRPARRIQPEMARELEVAEEAGVGIYGLKMVLNKKGQVLLATPDIPVILDS